MQTRPPSQSTHLCPHCEQAISAVNASCPWCGTLHPYSVPPLNLPDCFQAAQVSIQALHQSHLPLTETTYLAVGGGLGSFAWVDYLRVCGAAANQIIVVGREATPYGRFQRLCRNSQIFDDERIRSDSGAMPDNLWGWPGYAVQEIASLIQQNKWREAGRIAWQIFSEPVLAETYAPRSKMVFAALEREMKRISWRQMFRRGEVCAIRQTDDGRYVVVYVPGGGGNGRPAQLLIAPYLHLALGYPAIQMAPETQVYRRATGDLRRVVQAYEPHEHIYEELGQRGGLLILRGRGIVASRILQRLDEVRRATGKNIRVVHLLRSPFTNDTFYGRAHRRTYHHWQLQPFNWPKAALGGDLRVVLERATVEERQTLFATWGGSTTSDRRDWQEIVERGLREGWYSSQFGTIEEMKVNGEPEAASGRTRLVLFIQNSTLHRLVANFMIDCTGLNAQLSAHPLLADLSQRYGLRQNGSGRLLVTPDFEVKGMRNGYGQIFMAGTMAFGNAFAPVDGFLGLQYAAQRSVDALIRENVPGLHTLNGHQSLRQWWRWWQGLEP